MDDAKELTPAQLAEIEENNMPFVERFKALVDEAGERLRHGTTLTQTFVDGLTKLYEEVKSHG